jgi:hypothetical protein
MQVMDVFLILLVLFGWLLFTYKSLSSSVASFSIVAIFWSGISGAMIGFLSVFQSNLTKLKRLILLVVSVLPICFAMFASWLNKPLPIWDLGLIYLTYCWIINGPAIIAGQHITRVGWLLMRKLKLVSGEYPE